MSTVSEASQRPATGGPVPADPAPARHATQSGVATVVVAAVLVAIAFATGGGVDELAASPGNTWTEIALLALGVVAVSVACLRAPGGRRSPGLVTTGLFVALFALSAASVAWSVVPDSSWLASGQLLAYLALFATGVALVRLAPDRWAVLLGGITLATVALCGWSLLVKVVPSLAPVNEVGRLQAPFGYWNAIAVSAVVALPGCMWLGARCDGGRRMAALAAPALALAVAVLVLSYSRSADLAAVVAAGLWLVFVPLRLRAAAWLLLGGLGGAAISVWGLASHHVTGAGVRPALQASAGHRFGVVIVVVLAVMALGGWWLARRMDRAVLSPQRRFDLGLGLSGLVAVAVIGALLALATSHRGLTGEISHGWHELANPTATVSATSAGRVFDFGSSRPLYWHQALDVGDHAVLKGTGLLGFSEARLRYPSASPEAVFNAHSYVFETYADLGVLGLLVSAALLLAWLGATARAVQFGRSWASLDAGRAGERVGLATLAVIVVGFGVQSTLDWTWFFAGVVAPVLLAAGWLAGRGRPGEVAVTAAAGRRGLDRIWAVVGVPVLVALALLAGWMMWRPLHSSQLVNSVVDGTASDPVAAAEAARSADPLSLTPYQTLAALHSHEPALAASELRRATQVQPENPNAWMALAAFDIQHRRWQDAVRPLQRVAMLDHAPNAMIDQVNAWVREVEQHYHPPASG